METFLKLLGTPKVILGQEPQALPNDKRGALLAYLAFQNDWVSREQLAFLFWPDNDQGVALANLRQLLHRSKQLVYATNLDIKPEQVRWQFSTDVAIFQKNLHDQDWLKSIEHYQDHFLNNFNSDSPGFEAWLEIERSNLKLSWQEAAFKVTENLSKTDRSSDAANLLLQLWRLSDYNENFLQTYLKQAYTAGQKTVALAAFQAFREQLLKTFEVDVSEETQELIQAIKSDTLKTEKPSRPLTKPQPKRSSQPLLGRQQELSELTNLLKNPECRALCLMGPGGVGKTRLAQELSQQLLADYEHGVYFVPLASISKPEEITNAIASSLSFTFYGRTEPKVQLANYLRNKTMLLLVDNLEHVLEGASILAELLAEVPELKLLITSRQLPELAEVWPFALQGLSYQEPESDAENLFVQLATKQQPRFQVSEAALENIRQICKLVEGLPLAIELAASWVRELSPKEILEQLGRSFEILKRDGQRQHDSMGAVFDYSWQLLSPEQQTLLAQLSVFRGGFTSAAAEAVAGVTPYLLLSLQNRSLLTKDEAGRYGLHELVRQYAERKLEQPSHESVLEKHLRYFQSLAGQADKNLRDEYQIEWKTRIRTEHNNFNHALEWAFKHRLNDALVLTAYLGRYWHSRGLLQEGETWLKKAIANSDNVSAETQAQLYVFHAAIVIGKGDYKEAETLEPTARAFFQRFNNPSLEAEYCNSIGWKETTKQNYDQATTILQRGLKLAAQAGDKSIKNYLLLNLARLAGFQNDTETALNIQQECLDLARERRDTQLVMTCLSNMAWLNLGKEEYTTSITQSEEALVMAKLVDDQGTIAIIQGNLGYAKWQLGNYVEGEQIYRQHLLLMFEHGNMPYFVDNTFELAQFWTHLGFTKDAVCLWGAAEGLRTTHNYPVFNGYEDIKTKVLGSVQEPKRSKLLQQGQNLSPRELLTFITKAAQPA